MDSTKYLETTIPGEVNSWRRVDEIRLKNIEPPMALVYEVERTVYPDGFQRDIPTAQFDIEMTDPTQEIPLVDPVTFEPTGQTFQAGAFFAMAASLYFWRARQRDGIES
jgi:hypothetical protein